MNKLLIGLLSCLLCGSLVHASHIDDLITLNEQMDVIIENRGKSFDEIEKVKPSQTLARDHDSTTTVELQGSIPIWRVNSQGRSKHKGELCNDDCSFEGVLREYGLPSQPFIDNESKYGVRKELAVCIAWADSHLGRALKSKNNIGNVGNNDRGDVVHYATIQDGIEAMYRVLNNRYLGHKQSVGSLSVGGGGDSPYYATSPENRNNNVLNCLNTILNPTITEEWVFRI